VARSYGEIKETQGWGLGFGILRSRGLWSDGWRKTGVGPHTILPNVQNKFGVGEKGKVKNFGQLPWLLPYSLRGRKGSTKKGGCKKLKGWSGRDVENTYRGKKLYGRSQEKRRVTLFGIGIQALSLEAIFSRSWGATRYRTRGGQRET